MQSFISENPIRLWQFVFAVLAILGWISGYKKITEDGSSTAYFPIATVLLAAPIVSNLWATKPWTSYGLITIVFVVYATDLDNYWLIAFSGITALTLQIAVVEMDLKTITDRSDLALGNTYFASCWLISILISTLVIRKLFLGFANRIDADFEMKFKQHQSGLRRLRLLNLQDYLNLKLHGTVLNTLLVMKNRILNNQEISELLPILAREIADFEKSQDENLGSLSDQITRSFAFSSNRRTKINFQIDQLSEFSKTKFSQIIEIVRESINNIERHTEATEITIVIKVSIKRALQITVFENSVLVQGGVEIEKALEDANSSVTLRRLIAAVEGESRVYQDDVTGLLVHEIIVDLANKNDEINFPSGDSTGNSFDVISRNFVMASAIYGLLIFLPLIVSNEIKAPIYLYSSSIFLFLISVIRSRFSKFFASLASILGATVIPAFIWNEAGCVDLTSLPWIFNGLLGPILGVSILKFSKGSYIAKWLPISVIILESFSTIWFLPTQCNQILQGSTPGLLVIAVAALLLGRARRSARKRYREIAQDYENSARNLEFASEELAQERRNIVNDLQIFQNKLASSSGDTSLLVNELQIQIERIRAFLLCSEYFDSSLIKEIYKLVKQRIVSGNQTKMEIFAENSQFRDVDSNLASTIAMIFRSSQTGPMDMQLFSGGNQITFSIPTENYNNIPVDSRSKLLKQGIKIITR